MSYRDNWFELRAVVEGYPKELEEDLHDHAFLHAYNIDTYHPERGWFSPNKMQVKAYMHDRDLVDALEDILNESEAAFCDIVIKYPDEPLALESGE